MIQTLEQESLLPKLLRFNYSIEYKPGPTNQAVDALSRSFHMAVSVPISFLLDDIKRAVSSYPSLQALIQEFRTDRAALPQHTMTDGLLFGVIIC